MPRPNKPEWKKKSADRQRLLGRGWGAFCNRVGLAHESGQEIWSRRGDAAKIEFLLQFYEENCPLAKTK